jgi:predicted transglutaminase-like cysteine proteinase
MSALFKFSIFLFLAFAVAISIYLFGPQSEDDVIYEPPTQEASIAPVAPPSIPPVAEAPVAPVDPAAAAVIDEELDYEMAQRIGSLDGWRAFLTAHGSGLHAQSARTEVDKLLHAEKTPAPAAAEVSHGGSEDAQATSEAAPSTATEAAPLVSYEICRREEERVGLLRDSSSNKEAMRFPDDLRCEKLRLHLSDLLETFGSSAPEPAAAADASNGLSPDAKAASEAAPPAVRTAESEVAPSTHDEICKRDEERLEQLRKTPSSEETARFASELGCEKLRPQLLRLTESLGPAVSTPASVSESASTKPSLAVGLEAASNCPSEQDRLNRIRAQPSADTARQFWRDLQCGRLRPQVRLLLESLNIAADPAACQREAEELNRIRTNPERREAEGFARDMTCDALKPQAARLLESLAD